MRWFLSIGAMIALSVAVMAGSPASASPACLRWNDIETLTRSGPDTVLAKTRHKGDFQIKFRGACDYQRSPANFFIIRLHDRWECVSSLHVLDVHEGGACFIESIARVK